MNKKRTFQLTVDKKVLEHCGNGFYFVHQLLKRIGFYCGRWYAESFWTEEKELGKITISAVVVEVL